MNDPSSIPSAAAVQEFLALLLADRERGESRSLEAYQALFPGHEAAIASKFEELGTANDDERSVDASCTVSGPVASEPSIEVVASARRGELDSDLVDRLAAREGAIGRYDVGAEVARGGQGTVLRVWDKDLRRPLAMKVLRERGASESGATTPRSDPRSLGRFLEEAQVTGQLDHPGMVPIHELGLDAQGRLYFTMKLVRGEDLRHVFAEVHAGDAEWTPTRALGVLLKVCEAMAYAHSKGVIHRDLKPANVMVGKYGEVYVMDWGLARVLGSEDRRDLRVRPETSTASLHTERRDAARDPESPLMTMDGDVVGTPAYMPPEQALGDLGAMGPHSDVYAVGAMLYHLLAGEMPYVPSGSRLNNYAVWYQVQKGPPDPLAKLAPEAPAELVAICEKAMARESGERYGDMMALAEDLRAYLEHRVVRAYETGTWAETRKWVQRNKALAGSLAAAVLVLVAGLVTTWTLKTQSETRATQVLRLSDVKLLQELEDEAGELWPPHPDRSEELEAWIGRARTLLERGAEHRATLEGLRVNAHPWSEEQRLYDRRTHPLATELELREGDRSRVEARMALDRNPQRVHQDRERLAGLEGEIERLSAAVNSRRTWRFDTPEAQWRHDLLAGLVGRLEDLEAGLLAADSVSQSLSWSVPRRLDFALGLDRDEESVRIWRASRPALDEAYPGLELEPQAGLLPLGPDPCSGLWEFAHLVTGEPAERGAGGELLRTEATGIVLVLLPGGSFWMGAQSKDPAGRNYDPEARPDEAPVHEVELSPFFVSKYEVTQSQWSRLTGSVPNTMGFGQSLGPVNRVSWEECVRFCQWTGLDLPSEAQWEYAARAGTTSPWWTGEREESLAGAANLSDVQARDHAGAAGLYISFMVDAVHLDWLDDGSPVSARVGSYAPNAFGLHDVHGNVEEWCLDIYHVGFYVFSPRKDPLLRPIPTAKLRTLRGGSFNTGSELARVSWRGRNVFGFSDSRLGLRPIRRIDP